MAVTRTFTMDREQSFQEIEKLTNSHSLRGSDSLCRLLRYLAEHSLANPPSPVKEYQIATEVFGRSAHFDPQADSTVRVQVGRLRTKLAEYYGSEGVDDPVLVDLPKGSYVLSFHPRAAETTTHSSVPFVHESEASAAQHNSSTWFVGFVVVSILLAASLVAIAMLVSSRRSAVPAFTGEIEPVPAALRIFWSPFVTRPEEPWVIFSNAAFVGRPETGMRYYNSARDQRDLIWDHYTGVGEVLAVHSLDQVFGLFRRRIRVKRGSLFSLDDVQNNDLIFVGSPSENLTLLDIPGSKEFVFQRLTSGPRQGDLAIVNVHPHSDEPRVVVASPSTSPLTEDYAVVALMPGLNPARSVLILAGTTTFGTQGAVEFASRQNSVADLLSRLSATKATDLKPFEALLRVKIARGVPVETELVAVRKRTP
ncbi:MAG: helix-turn-helix domain-containing protein [Candidatus Sulfotelmatobacter sp.]